MYLQSRFGVISVHKKSTEIKVGPYPGCALGVV